MPVAATRHAPANHHLAEPEPGHSPADPALTAPEPGDSPADGALIGEQPGDFVRIRHPDTPLTQVASIAVPSMENAGKAWLRDKAQAPRAHRMARSAIRRRITLWQPGNPAIRRRIDRRGVPAELLVRYLVQDRGHLADPAAVVEAADEAAVARVAGHVHELLGRDQGPEPGEIAVLWVADDS